MDSEKVMELFDSCWFEMKILERPTRSSSFEANPDHQIEENPSKDSKPKDFSRIPTIHRRSMSAQLSSDTNFNSFSLSPNSVLSTPKLQTIISGKEIAEDGEDQPEQAHVFKKKAANPRRKKKISQSKSLSDLEFQELKGLMDLGFVFTEEDNKDSRLVEIVPGLQRLRKMDETVETIVDKSPVSRPYLSEAWEFMDSEKKENNPLTNWKIPAVSNEIDMKDNLRWWAHTVALSAVR
ncbi:hypothetical protein Patl1_10470 [Pistacia atlantica]|uniref:Uncharacterized protein n=1 Tax=Pistacia atlantica TaxID=434234 RepID=A0ACC1A4A0_9ROSI|nr:hypothetical protein Patl1_10470 [Pistacia atlantica]